MNTIKGLTANLKLGMDRIDVKDGSEYFEIIPNGDNVILRRQVGLGYGYIGNIQTTCYITANFTETISCNYNQIKICSQFKSYKFSIEGENNDYLFVHELGEFSFDTRLNFEDEFADRNIEDTTNKTIARIAVNLKNCRKVLKGLDNKNSRSTSEPIVLVNFTNVDYQTYTLTYYAKCDDVINKFEDNSKHSCSEFAVSLSGRTIRLTKKQLAFISSYLGNGIVYFNIPSYDMEHGLVTITVDLDLDTDKKFTFTNHEEDLDFTEKLEKYFENSEKPYSKVELTSHEIEEKLNSVSDTRINLVSFNSKDLSIIDCKNDNSVVVNKNVILTILKNFNKDKTCRIILNHDTNSIILYTNSEYKSMISYTGLYN